jgi:hypothetical protein
MGSSEKGGRFANLKRTAERVEAGSLRPTPEPPQPPTEGGSTLKERLAAQKPAREATIRLSLDLNATVHDQLAAIGRRVGMSKAEVVREILREVIPELLDG